LDGSRRVRARGSRKGVKRCVGAGVQEEQVALWESPIFLLVPVDVTDPAMFPFESTSPATVMPLLVLSAGVVRPYAGVVLFGDEFRMHSSQVAPAALPLVDDEVQPADPAGML
jgi:hypothetical protein